MEKFRIPAAVNDSGVAGTHRRHCSTGINAATLRSLSRRSLFPWVFHATADWLTIAFALVLAGWHPGLPTILAAILVIGNRQHALAILGHDGTHYTLSRHARVNDLLTNLLCFWPLGLTVSGYRALHYAHHKNTGMDQDPELAHKRMRQPQWDLPASRWTVLGCALKDLIGYSLKDFVIIVSFSRPARRSHYIPLSLFHVLAIAAALAAGLWWAAVLWYASLVTSFMMFFRLRLWLEHQGTGTTQRIALKSWQAWILAPHNAWYHWEHHAYAAVPYHKLPRIRALIPEPVPVTLGQLVRSFETSRPIPSGTPLNHSAGA